MLTKNSKKIVIKLGSSTVIDKNGKFKSNWVNSLIKDIKKYKQNRDIVIVSSSNRIRTKLFKNKAKENST